MASCRFAEQTHTRRKDDGRAEIPVYLGVGDRRSPGQAGGPDFGLDADHAAVLVSLDEQSPDIALGVNRALESREHGDHDGYLDSVGAGDQGLVFGFATDETPEYLPTSIALAHRLARRLTEVRKSGELPYLRPDGKTQVTVEYEGDRVVRIDTIVVSAQHDPDVTPERIREDIHAMLDTVREVGWPVDLA